MQELLIARIPRTLVVGVCQKILYKISAGTFGTIIRELCIFKETDKSFILNNNSRISKKKEEAIVEGISYGQFDMYTKEVDNIKIALVIDKANEYCNLKIEKYKRQLERLKEEPKYREFKP